jgi:hypothetical protein
MKRPYGGCQGRHLVRPKPAAEAAKVFIGDAADVGGQGELLRFSQALRATEPEIQRAIGPRSAYCPDTRFEESGGWLR